MPLWSRVPRKGLKGIPVPSYSGTHLLKEPQGFPGLLYFLVWDLPPFHFNVQALPQGPENVSSLDNGRPLPVALVCVAPSASLPALAVPG